MRRSSLLKKNNKPPEFFQTVTSFSQQIEQELQTDIYSQFQRDSILWYNTLKYPGSNARRDVLRRIFAVLRWGDFMYKPRDEKENWKLWSETKLPISAALSHGARVMIQLPMIAETNGVKGKKSVRDHSFWQWLITGKADGNIFDFVSIATSGRQAEKEEKIIFRRLAATHGIEYLDSGKWERNLPLGKCKYLLETKTRGISFRDCKSLISSKLSFHRHWAMNIPLGGCGKTSLTGETISANGEHGHLYIYYMSPSHYRNGGILIGLEGSEFGKYDCTGHKHSMTAKCSKYSPTWGLKWQNMPQVEGPRKYNGMFVDLSQGWEFLEEKMKEWKDEFVMQGPVNRFDERISSTVMKTKVETLLDFKIPRQTKGSDIVKTSKLITCGNLC